MSFQRVLIFLLATTNFLVTVYAMQVKKEVAYMLRGHSVLDRTLICPLLGSCRQIRVPSLHKYSASFHYVASHASPRASGHRRSKGCGPHRAALARGGKLAKIVFLNSRENSDCIISYVFACNKNKALQLQRVPILSILGYSIDLYFKKALQFPKPETKGRQI